MSSEPTVTSTDDPADTSDKEDDSDDSNGVKAITPNQGPDREEMVAGYLPGSDDWDAKTQLDIDDPAKLALIRNYAGVMPEVEHLEDMLDSFATDFVKAQTSIGGDSRSDYRQILMGMFGADDSEDDAVSSLAKALGADDEDD